MSVNVNNSNDVVPRSSSVDSAIFDGGEDSPDEIFDGEEESFDELNEDNQQDGQCKLVFIQIEFDLIKYLYLLEHLYQD